VPLVRTVTSVGVESPETRLTGATVGVVDHMCGALVTVGARGPGPTVEAEAGHVMTRWRRGERAPAAVAR